MIDLLGGEWTERTELPMVRERPIPFPPEAGGVRGNQPVRWSMARAEDARCAQDGLRLVRFRLS